MAFQDFDHVSERRRTERKQKERKRILIISVSILLLLLIAASAAAVVVHKHNKESNPTSNSHSSSGARKQISKSQKAVKTICARTDYRKICEDSISREVGSNDNALEPKDLVKAAISVVRRSLHKATDQSSRIKPKTAQQKGALKDCMVLLKDANEELNSSVASVGVKNLKKMLSCAPELNNWLSAVMSYQATCIGEFPGGELKSTLEKALFNTTRYTSNALAIVSELSSLLETFNIQGKHRHLQASEPRLPSLDEDRLPTWMTPEDRRLLKEHKEPHQDDPAPNVVVAIDGSGNYTTINAALAAMPAKYQGRYVIYIKEGVYEEYVTVTKKMENVTMYGDGSEKTIVSGHKNSADGVRSLQTATFVAIGKSFMAKSMGFKNNAGPGKAQAVALRVQSDHSIFYNCRMEGYQHTLYTQTHRQYYRSCLIVGSVDFIFGDAAAIFQNCVILVRKGQAKQENTVTAQARFDRRETTGIVLQNCRILADAELEPQKSKFKSYLGRPGKECSRTIVMNSEIGDVIHPKGWQSVNDFAVKTVYFAEFNNKGAGANVGGRVKWPGYKAINKEEALKFTVAPFIQGNTWLNQTGVPVHFGLFK